MTKNLEDSKLLDYKQYFVQFLADGVFSWDFADRMKLHEASLKIRKYTLDWWRTILNG